MSVVLALFVPLFCGALALAALPPAERAVLSAEGRRAADPALVAMLDEQPSVAAPCPLAVGRSEPARPGPRSHAGRATERRGSRRLGVGPFEASRSPKASSRTSGSRRRFAPGDDRLFIGAPRRPGCLGR